MDKKIVNRFFTVFFIAVFVVIFSICGTVSSIADIRSGKVKEDKPASALENVLGGQKDSDALDMENFGQNILSKVMFDTELQKLDDSSAHGMINVAEDSKIFLYTGSGNYSDLLVLVEASSETNAKSDQTVIEQHLKDMRESFEAYIPKEAKKISNALIVRSGCYIIVCVTDDIENAKRVVLAGLE